MDLGSSDFKAVLRASELAAGRTPTGSAGPKPAKGVERDAEPENRWKASDLVQDHPSQHHAHHAHDEGTDGKGQEDHDLDLLGRPQDRPEDPAEDRSQDELRKDELEVHGVQGLDVLRALDGSFESAELF